MMTARLLISFLLITTVSQPTIAWFENHFQLDTSGLGPVRIGVTWQDRSLVSCITNCMEAFSACSSVIYNPITQKCTPGSTLVSTAAAPSIDEGLLYVKMAAATSTYCNTNSGLSYETYGSVSSCIGLFASILSFSHYPGSCVARNAKTVKVTSIEKLQILQQISNGTDFWIGCMDDGRGNVIWEDDSQPLSGTLIGQIFGQGETSKTYPGGNCCQYCPHNRTAVMADCSTLAPFACEM